MELRSVVVGMLLQIVRGLLHLRGTLTTATHHVPLGVSHSSVSSIGVRERDLLGHAGRSAIPGIVLIVLTVLLIQVTLAVQVRVAVLHAGGCLLDFARCELLQICNARFEPFHALFLASVGSRDLLLVDVVIVASVARAMLWASGWSLILRLSASLARLAGPLGAVGGPTSATVTKMWFHSRNQLD